MNKNPTSSDSPAHPVRPHPSPAYGSSPYGGDSGAREPGEFDPRRTLRFILRRWKTVLLITLVGLAVGTIYLQLTTPLYLAQAEIEMSVLRPKIVLSAAVYEEQGRDTDVIINTRFAKFRSVAMEDLVVGKYVEKYPQETLSEKQLRGIIRSSVVWSKDKESSIVRVSVTGPDPEFNARLANILSGCAGELMARENQAMSDEAVRWLKDQVKENQAALEAVEHEQGEVRQAAQMDALTQKRKALGESLTALSSEWTGQQNRLAAAQTQYDYLVSLQKTDPDLETLPEGLPRQELLATLIGNWRTANEALREMAGRYTSGHPDYQSAEVRLQAAREQLNRFAETLVRTLENQIELLKRQSEQVTQRMLAFEKESLSLDQKMVQGGQRLAQLERRYEAADNAYKALLKRMEEVRLSADEKMAFTKVVREASVPSRPFSPKTSHTLAIALLLGLAAGVGLACIIELWLDEVSAVTELAALGLNIIGIIPRQKNIESREDLAAIGLRDKFSHVFELFAGFTAMLSSNRLREQTRVLLINSVMPGEGKTICSTNLAVSSALNGSRTLLIDGDLRRPRLAKIFGVSDEHPSLLEWLSDKENSLDFEHLVSKNVHEHLDLITSRPLEGVNPAELMGRGRIRELIQWARENYDRVIIDSPPFGLAGDVQVLANEADSVILVSRIGVTRRGALKHALNRFVEIDVNVLGCIANDVVLNIGSKLTGGYSDSQYASYGKY